MSRAELAAAAELGMGHGAPQGRESTREAQRLFRRLVITHQLDQPSGVTVREKVFPEGQENTLENSVELTGRKLSFLKRRNAQKATEQHEARVTPPVLHHTEFHPLGITGAQRYGVSTNFPAMTHESPPSTVRTRVRFDRTSSVGAVLTNSKQSFESSAPQSDPSFPPHSGYLEEIMIMSAGRCCPLVTFTISPTATC